MWHSTSSNQYREKEIHFISVGLILQVVLCNLNLGKSVCMRQEMTANQTYYWELYLSHSLWSWTRKAQLFIITVSCLNLSFRDRLEPQAAHLVPLQLNNISILNTVYWNVHLESIKCPHWESASPSISQIPCLPRNFLPKQYQGLGVVQWLKHFLVYVRLWVWTIALKNVNKLHLLTAVLALMVEERAGKEAVWRQALGPEKAQMELDANPAVMPLYGQWLQ